MQPDDVVTHRARQGPLVLKVGICIATYRRPDGLRALLDGLTRLVFPSGTMPEISVVVVDNDPSGTARGICEAISTGFPFPLMYLIEQKPGISSARNRGIDAVVREVDVIAMIDDDEVPDPTWLDELILARASYGAHIILGRVCPLFPSDAPRWIVEGGFFQSVPARTGSTTRAGGAGNCLMDARLFREDGLRFDERYAQTGGEDSHLFWRAWQRGLRSAI